MAKHKTGGKITTSHTSIIDAALPVVEAAEKLPEVTKISLGIIKQVGKSLGQHRMKFLPITGLSNTIPMLNPLDLDQLILQLKSASRASLSPVPILLR